MQSKDKADKKILFVANTDSFIELFLLPYLKSFKNSGYEVHVATNTNKTIPFCDKKIQIPIERSPKKISSNLKAVKILREYIERENYAVINCHTPMGGAIARLAARKVDHSKTRVIYTAHGFHFYKGAPLHYWTIFYLVEKYLAKYTDTLITINDEDFEQALHKFSKRCNDIKYIPGVGIDKEKFEKKSTEKEKQKLRALLGLSDNDFVMIFPAELSKRKNQMWLIETLGPFLKKHGDAHILLPGKDSSNGECQKFTEKLGLSKQIHFLGFRKDIPELIDLSNLALSSAKQEGLPVNIMEAMCHGLPCVVINCRGNRDLVKNNYGGKVIPLNDKEKFLSAIEYFYDNKNACKKCGDFNSKEAKKYSLDIIEKEYDKVYFRKKKIVYIRNNSIYNDPRAQKEIKALQEKYDVVVLGWDREQKYRNKETNYNRYILFDKRAEYGAGIRNFIKLWQFQKWLKAKLSQIPNIDLIYACDFDTAYTASKFAKKNHKKYVYDIYDYYVDCHSMPKIMRKIIENKDIKTINGSDLTVICSEERAEQIKKTSPKKVIVIHNSIDLEDYKLKNNFCKTPKNGNTKIAYVGILQNNRLLKEVGQKISQEKNLELHIGGFGQYEDYFRDLAKNNKNIFFYGVLKYPETLSLEKSCDVLFATYNPEVPNHRYSAPNKIYEAINLQKPIIVCKNTGVDKIVTENHLGLVIDYDGDAFINAIKELNLTYKKNGNLLQEYGWKTMRKRLLENIGKVI